MHPQDAGAEGDEATESVRMELVAVEPGEGTARPSRARLAAGAMLLVVLVLLVQSGSAVYRAMTDSFIAPSILSPDNDSVIQTELGLVRLESEREALRSRIEEENAQQDAALHALRLLGELRDSNAGALAWPALVTEGQEAHGATELDLLERQRQLLLDAQTRQERHLRELQDGLAAGLVHAADVEREQRALDELRVSVLGKERDLAGALTQLAAARTAREALTGRERRGGVVTPEMLSQAERRTRIQIEALRYEAESRARDGNLRAQEENLARLDELISRMRSRPILRAMEARQNLAFVPYGDAAGVVPGASVHRCTLWGFFGCRQVGVISEILPGEVTTQDPWGSASRGQYALMSLTDPSAAEARSLRVRPPAAPPAGGEVKAAMR